MNATAILGKGEATRERILQAAAGLASLRGLAAVSLQDVAQAVGISKSGLVKHFPAKEEMQLALLERAAERFLDRMWWPFRDLATPRQRLEAVNEAWLDWIAGSDTPGGCLLMAASVELDDQPGPLRDFLLASQQRWRGRLAGDLRLLSDPPLSDEDADQAVFEIKGVMLSYAEQRRLLEDEHARDRAKRALGRLLDGLAAGR